MAEDLIRFDILAQDALRGVVRKVLSEVALTGLPGEHHFFISFSTQAPGVRLSSRLLAQYPEEMTIILQHQFWDLSVTDTAFEVGLSFNNVPERLLVPFSAIKGFADPSVQFALQFEPATSKEPTESTPEKKSQPDVPAVPLTLPTEKVTTQLPAQTAEARSTDDGDDEAAKERREAEVVSLDAFRKK